MKNLEDTPGLIRDVENRNKIDFKKSSSDILLDINLETLTNNRLQELSDELDSRAKNNEISSEEKKAYDQVKDYEMKGAIVGLGLGAGSSITVGILVAGAVIANPFAAIIILAAAITTFLAVTYGSAYTAKFIGKMLLKEDQKQHFKNARKKVKTNKQLKDKVYTIQSRLGQEKAKIQQKALMTPNQNATTAIAMGTGGATKERSATASRGIGQNNRNTPNKGESQNTGRRARPL